MATAVGKNKSYHRTTSHDIIEIYSFDSSNTDCETSPSENTTTGS